MTVISDEGEEVVLASSPCFLHELGADGSPRVDLVQARDVANWRKAERQRLLWPLRFETKLESCFRVRGWNK